MGLNSFAVVLIKYVIHEKAMRLHSNTPSFSIFLLLLISFMNGTWAKTEIILIAGKDSHGTGAHNWGEGVDLLSTALTKESGLNIATRIHKGGGPRILRFLKMQQPL